MNINSSKITSDDESKNALDDVTASQVAELFRTFGDASRVKIVSLLINAEMNVGAVVEKMGISESAVSHQLRNLRQMQLVKARRDGKEIYYRMDDEHLISLFRQGVDHVRQG
jgi:ArsR family transcriptional regulator, lead/cadmium/zinc/bismuth-responsive transcriptional repressor